MKLAELEPVFQRHEQRIETWTRRHPDGMEEEITGPSDYYVRVDSLAEAQGIRFLCPKAFHANGGKVGGGTHSVWLGFEGRCPPETFSKGSNGEDTRWVVSGTGFDDLTLSPSIQEVDGGLCAWHGFVRNGEITDA